jgi:glycosyltransferase involved in cell wall biosynthesis
MDRPLRVAVTLEQCWHTVPGGTARAALDSIRALQAHTDVDLVGVSARHGSPPPPAWAPSIPVEALPLPRLALYESWHRLRRPAVERATGPVDVIHATGMAVPPPTAPLVVTVHDLAFLRDPARATRRGASFFRRAIELARADATIVICPSQATLDDCVANGFDPARLRLVPWGIEADPVDPATVAGVRARFGLGGPFVLWSGTIEPRKNLPTLLDAFERLDDPDVTLVLAGPQGWNEDIAPRLDRLADRVRAVGFVDPDALRALYAGASVFCFPSLEEGFGLPVLEAMAQGTPVITSSGTATAEVAGDAGVLVDPTDVAALADALRRVLADATDAAALGEAGRVRAIAEFSWSRTAGALLDAYTEAAA